MSLSIPRAGIIMEQLKLCTACARNLPLTEFKWRARSQGRRLTSWCRECINESARRRRAHRRAILLGSVQQRVGHHSKATRVESVISAACRKAGGVEAFADQIAGALRSGDALMGIRASRLVLNLMIARERLASETVDD